MTLMPVAAFAADTTYTVEKASVVFDAVNGNVKVSATTGSVYSVGENGALTSVGPVPARVTDAGEYVVISGTAPATLPADAKTVTVTATDLTKADPIAAYDHSAILTKDRNASVDTEEAVAVRLLIQNKWDKATKADGLYIWATQGTSKVPATALLVAEGDPVTGEDSNVVEGVYFVDEEFTTTAMNGKAFDIAFASAGTYKIHASFTAPTFENGKIADAKELTTAEATSVIEVVGGTLSSKNYQAKVTLPAAYDIYKDINAENATTKNVNNAVVVDGNVIATLQVEANNVAEEEVIFKLQAPNGNALPYKDVKISAAGAIDVSAETVTTDRLGEASFKVSGSHEGLYKVYVTCGQFEFTIEVQVGATQANTIECTDEPENPIDIIGETSLHNYVEFTMYDVNGNKLKAGDSEVQGWDKAENSTKTNYEGKDVTGYVAIISQPSASKIANNDLSFDGVTINSKRAFKAEGVYEFKVVLNNGNYAIAKVEIKEFTTPVELVLKYPATVELGSEVELNDLYWLDANKVEKSAKGKVNLAATGYAVEDFNSNSGLLTVKGDEKYVGAEITVTAVDERYNLIDTAVIKVANGASELAFATKTAEVKVNNKIRVNVVDEDGNVVALGNNQDKDGIVDISYVILDKPEGARVFASTVSGSEDHVFTDGYFDMNLTSNQIGNVAVQAVLKYTAPKGGNEAANVVKYYTGTQIFAVGNGSAGDVVVMSINSNEIVINDAKATIDAAPIVKNDRTFVPFRALAEAFGAEVAYDEATQAVTAELNGVKVVMTIGSATYTVNGAEKTMDVAPFINGSRTMVPVRFVAEAFGIKVIPTYDENGATADILFNL